MLSRKVCFWRGVLRPRFEESGQALLFVLIAVALLVSIPLAIATTTVNQLGETTRNLNYDAAYEAAQAGLNDYLQDLDNSSIYSQYSKSNPPSGGNAAFTGWVQASTTPAEYYSYSPSILASTGLISLEVSGKAGTGSGQVVRTFDYTVRPATSLNDIYWSNYETTDPALNSSCGSVYYGQLGGVANPSQGIPSGCVIEFDSADVLDGPVFSNDTFRTCGTPTFESTVESGDSYYTSADYVVLSGCTGTPTFQDGQPTAVGNTPPQNQIPTADAGYALANGCEFTGNVTLAMTALTSGQHTTSIAWSGGTLASGSKSWCGSGSSGTINLSNMTAGLIYTPGNITVSGSMAGSLDLMANNGITISGSLTYPSGDIVTAANGSQSDTQDVLGLVAQNFISISPTTNAGTTIDAAILSLTDSFYYPNWTSNGLEGTLTVFGSIAQNYRGPVGTANSNGGVATGFSKSYHYDTSLQTVWPPYFVPPTSAAWGATSYSECLQGLVHSVQGTKTVC